jgi:hypothetical protein
VARASANVRARHIQTEAGFARLLLQTLNRRRSMNDTFEDTGAVELTVLDDDALDNVTGGLLNRSFVAGANGGIPIGTPIALLFIAAALIFLPAIFEQASSGGQI